MYTEQLTIFGQARTTNNRITIQAVNSQDKPKIQGGILVRNSSNITVKQLDASNVGGHGAVVIDQGSNNIIVDQVFAHDSLLGIVVGTAVTNGLGGPAGAYNSIQNNNVGTNVIDSGIAIGGGSGGTVPAGTYSTIVTNNNISGNGGYGIDIDSTRNVKAEFNRIETNGFVDGGRSGIHLYAYTDDNSCRNNIVRYNYVSNTLSPNSGSDGNGIQIDHYCDYNIVAFNVIWNNYGAGISIFTAAHNQVYANSLHFNSKQPNRSTNYPPNGNPTGELVMSSCDAVNPATGHSNCADGIIRVGRANNNHIFDNIVHSSLYGVPAINVSSSASSSSNQNVVGPNLLWVSNQDYSGPSANWAPLFFGGSTTSYNSAYVNQATGTSGNLVEYPFSLSEASPKSVLDGGQDGFKLTKKPSSSGFALSSDLPDIVSKLPTANSSNFGAYYCTASTAGASCAP